MLQPSPAPAAPLSERLRGEAGRRTLAVGLALAVELLLLLLLLTLGVESPPGEEVEPATVLRLAPEAAEEAPEPAAPEPAEAAPEQPPAEQPLPPQPARPAPPQPAEARPPPVAPPVLPTPAPPPPAAAVPRNPAPPAPAPARRRVYGPPNTGGSPAMRDSERVGTAPDGEPLYKAEWYREPDDKMLGDYLSTAQAPGWAVIDCRTAPGYRVEDCVGIGEYPQGSQIMRSVLAAAWEFRVRPARVGGRPLVGSWVRIRIDYTLARR